jgi:hypothetical protein
VLRENDKYLTMCDVQDALYTGSLKVLPEYKACGGDMQTYVNSVTSVHKTVQTAVGESKRVRFGAFQAIMSEMFDVSLLKSPTFIVVCISGFFVYLGEDQVLFTYLAA